MPNIERIEMEADLIRLSHDFAYYMDYRKYEKLIGLFTSDALFDRIMHVHRGHDEIRAGLNERSTAIMTRHISTNFHFEPISETEVRGVVYNMSYFGQLNAEGEAPAIYSGPGMLLEFHDRYVRTMVGWRFAERVARAALLDPHAPMLAGGHWRPEAD
ncbi:nuclear transport factor 2 family protein [Sphingobium sp. BS19]|uniref:nuclear transport factor 2 family protein n=1 Tax=Sphingobium sp. BS19 TaxID=3018973 RepID=UPI0022EE0E45|nr:nuclear transport factor 2 family protein [Sphingobium sp. BS19]GLJ00456.1 hypothetical protein Sbs19_42740 [Sphingobium sp. BS19]